MSAASACARATPDELGAIVRRRAQGRSDVVPGLHGALAGAVRSRRVADREPTSPQRRVSARCSSFLAEGRTNREIAAALSVTLATVKSHLVRIYAKLGAANRNEALGRAVALGLLG